MKIATEPTYAFPSQFEGRYTTQGMTLRDYFAGQAMIAICAAPTSIGEQGEIISGYDNWANHTVLAHRCYSLADAMMAAREVQA